MKCKVVRDDLEIQDVALLTPEQQKSVVWKPRGEKLVPYWPNGAEIEHPQAPLLVQCGVAIPADEACAKAAGMTEEQLQRAQVSASRVAAGIHPSDFAIFDAGFITGYQPDGSYKPGPRWDEYQKLLGEQAEQAAPLADDEQL